MKAQVFNLRFWIEGADANYIKHTLRRLADESDFTILDYTEHNFEPFGYTALWLLAESHLAVHTFPEHNRTYVELTSCNQDKHNHFEKLTRDTFSYIKQDD